MVRIKRTQPQGKTHSLSRRIVWQFCIFALLISAVYGLISFTLMYMLEDSFIEQQLQQEAAYLSVQYQQTGQWPAPRRSNMQLHFSSDTLPEELGSSALAEPERKEFFGQQGRHYHLYTVTEQPKVWLLAEVSNELLVRPIRDGVLQFLLLSALVVSCIACLLAWLVSRSTIRPLKQLATLVDGVAPERLPEHFAEQFPNHEVGVLARTLEQTLQRIAQAMQREKNFTRDVSHELRTPLAVLKNTVELWRSQHAPSKNGISSDDQCRTQAVMTRIMDAAEQMERTVQTLLILAREAHAPKMEQPAAALMPILEQAILDNYLLLKDKPVDVKLCDSCRVQLNANPDLLKVLLDNLLSNAFHYTATGEVRIKFERQQLLISDTGPGIEPAVISALASPGVKGQHSSGFGFGLSIVQRLCEHQGWQMTVRSGQGTQISILFLS